MGGVARGRMAYFLEFEHRLAYRRADEACAIILRWLEDQGAKVKEARPPDFLEALHGRALQPLGWKIDCWQHSIEIHIDG